MRTIKFRAWLNELKKMQSWEKLLENGWEFDDFNKEQYTLMQFTGLLDKNGKEEYHGDIVKISSSNSGGKIEPGIYEIVWFCSGFYIERETWGETIRYPLAETPNGNTEVIGNIYENSELITNL